MDGRADHRHLQDVAGHEQLACSVPADADQPQAFVISVVARIPPTPQMSTAEHNPDVLPTKRQQPLGRADRDARTWPASMSFGVTFVLTC